MEQDLPKCVQYFYTFENRKRRPTVDEYNRQRFAPLRAAKSTDCPAFSISEEMVKDNLE